MPAAFNRGLRESPLSRVDGRILVSDVVRQAVAGKDFEFEDRGEVDLKGFEEPLRAWSVWWK